ncbi:nitroreductase [Clostridium sp. P21]|uniref:Nitroreductase n=1 Tax=Clostridium muellerianum TaxID=2716538 RepID=A0A7Y0HKP7_9CLOT|nr:nitroreductase family protein [Clostridium muellerianum]NMM61139.1 nitroreductase [Clostridium muellerianum]
MQFYDVIKNRTSIKEFKNTIIDRDKVDRMINAAMMSPSWKNASDYKFIIVEDNAKKDIIASAVNNQTDEAGKSIKEAPMVVVVVADPDKSGEVDGKQYYLVDGAIAMEHFILAATEEGYGTCWIAALDEDVVKRALSIPEKYKVVGITPVGEIKQEKGHYAAKSAGEYVFHDSWNEAYVGNSKVLH